LGLVPISQINKSPENDKLYKPVDHSDPEIRRLVESIKENGLMQPIVLTADGFILSGHRRLEACKLAGLTHVPCVRDPISHDDPNFLTRLREHNRQRVKSFDEVVREQILDVNQEEAHDWLLHHRKVQAKIRVNTIDPGHSRSRAKISDAKQPLLNAVIEVLREREDYLPLSDRQIHYALLNEPPLRHSSKANSRYANDPQSYKSLVDLLTRARIEGRIAFESISDETRPMQTWAVHPSVGPFIKQQLDGFLTGYFRDYLQSQPNHIEIVAEKNTARQSLSWRRSLHKN